MIDLGQYDAMKTEKGSKGRQDATFKETKERLKEMRRMSDTEWNGFISGNNKA